MSGAVRRAIRFYSPHLAPGEEIKAIRNATAAGTGTLMGYGALIGALLGWLYAINVDGALMPALVLGAFAGEIGGYLYGAEENGGTNTIYVSPVPFEEINRGSEYGPGRPSMEPVADQMRQGNRLAAAMVVAPLAGIAAAAARMLRGAQPDARRASAGEPDPSTER